MSVVHLTTDLERPCSRHRMAEEIVSLIVEKPLAHSDFVANLLTGQYDHTAARVRIVVEFITLVSVYESDVLTD